MSGPITLVVVPARGGSKGLPDKNLRAVGGFSLVGRAVQTGIRFLRERGLDGSVLVDTDSPRIAEEARRFGAEVPFLRPAELATDTASTVDSVLHAVARLEASGRHHDVLVLLQPTSPLRSVPDVVACFAAYDAERGSVISVTPCEHPPQQALRLEADTTVSWVWPELAPGVRRQELGAAFRPSGAVYVTSLESLKRTRSFLVPGQTRGVVLPAERSVDVDTAADLALAEAILRGRPIRELRIGARSVGAAHGCYVIAEAGVNHNGDVALAHRLIDVAADAGADAVKFQTFEPASLVSDTAAMADYQVVNSGQRRTQAQMLQDLVLPRPAHAELMAHAAERGIEFLSSPFDEASADFLAELGVPALKVASGELTNHPFLAHLARLGRPLLVSSGMADLLEVDEALAVLAANGDPPVGLFHCVTSYPAAPEDTNLRAIATLQAAFGLPAGLSDHSDGIVVALGAVALGATLLEKHFTLDRNLPGPDHKASLEPTELGALVRSVREVEAALGDGDKRPRPVELPLRAAARKSVHAARDLPAGHVLGPGDLVALRPGTGLAPSRITALLGTALRKPIARGELLDEAHLG